MLTAVLIIDRNTERAWRAKYLKSRGIDIIEAASIDEVQGLLSPDNFREGVKNSVDIVLLGPLLKVDETSLPDILSRLQEMTKLPIIVTAECERDDLIPLILDSGAADFVKRDAHLEELVARVRLRGPREGIYEFPDDENHPDRGYWKIDTISRTIRYPNGRQIVVGTPRGTSKGLTFGTGHFHLLVNLIQSAPQPISSADMPKKFDTLIYQIRSVLGKDKIVRNGFTYSFDRVVRKYSQYRRSSEGGRSAIDRRGLKVLLVEDEEEAREILKTTLEARSFNVTAVETCKEAETKLPGSFDIILLDLLLPDTRSNRYNTILRIKNASSAPVIVLAAPEDENTSQVILNYGVSDFMLKPYDYEELFSRIRLLTRVPARIFFQEDDDKPERGLWSVDTAKRTLKRPSGEVVKGIGGRAVFTVLLRLLTSADGTVCMDDFGYKSNVAANIISELRREIGHEKIVLERPTEHIYRFCRRVRTSG